jgi:hypothetical protein
LLSRGRYDVNLTNAFQRRRKRVDTNGKIAVVIRN